MGGTLNNDYIIVLVTASDKQEAEVIAQNLLEEKLIACANIVNPVSSLFYWAGKIDYANETLILMKSHRDLFEQICRKVKSLHSYEVPEIIALPIIAGSNSYLEWIDVALK